MNKIQINGTNEFIFYDKSKYNMPVYIWENNKMSGFYLSLCVKFGSLHTNFDLNKNKYKVPKGIAHYMEHIKFNENKGFKANDYFDKLGSDINAFTTFEYTNYEVMAWENLEDNLSHLIYYVLNPYFTKEIINKERGIITEEIKMDKDDPYSNLFYRSLNNIFKSSNYRNPVAGEISDIKKITLSDIKLIYEAFYHPQNMFLVITGDVQRYKVMKIVNETLDKINIKPYSNIKIIKEKEPLKVLKTYDVFEDNVVVPKVKLSFKYPIKRFKNITILQLLIYSQIVLNANFGNTSDLKQYLLDNNLITSFYYSSNIFDDYFVIIFTFESDIYEEVNKMIITKMKSLDINNTFLRRLIKSSLADFILKFEDKEMVNSMIQNDIILNNKLSVNTHDIINNAKLSELKSFSNELKTNNYNVTVVTPKR